MDEFFDNDESFFNMPDILDISEKNNKKAGRKKSNVWEYFDIEGEPKAGHVGCICKFCGWKRKVGKAYEMVDYLAFTCQKITGEIRYFFLQEIKNRKALNISLPLPNSSIATTTTSSSSSLPSTNKKLKLQNQKTITSIFETTKIDTAKEQRCNRALTRFFICCGIPFHVVSNPFFVDFIRCLCPSYNLPNRVTFAGPWVNQELAHVTCSILDNITESNNITLGLFFLLF